MTQTHYDSALNFLRNFRASYTRSLAGIFEPASLILLGVPFTHGDFTVDLEVWRSRLRPYLVNAGVSDLERINNAISVLQDRSKANEVLSEIDGILRNLERPANVSSDIGEFADLRLRFAIYAFERSRQILAPLTTRLSYLISHNSGAKSVLAMRAVHFVQDGQPPWRWTKLVYRDPQSIIAESIEISAAYASTTRLACRLRESDWRRQTAPPAPPRTDPVGVLTDSAAASLAGEGVERDSREFLGQLLDEIPGIGTAAVVDDVVRDGHPLGDLADARARIVAAIKARAEARAKRLVAHMDVVGDFVEGVSDDIESMSDDEKRRVREIAGATPTSSMAEADRIKAAAAVEALRADTATYEEPEPPGVVVLASISHLPGSTAKPGAYGDKHSPTSEFGGMAGRRIPLREPLDVTDIASDLKASFPWATDVINTLLRDIVGKPSVRIRPTLLVGSPGCGKTALARALGNALELEPTLYSCAGVSDGAFGGTSRQWGTGRASIPLQAIRRSKIANPLIVLDEIEKASQDRRNGALVDVLLGFLERESSRAIFDPYVECGVDLSHVNYLATANSLDDLPPALRSRFRIIHMPMPSPEHVGVIAQRALVDIRAEEQSDSTWMPDLTPEEIHAITVQWTGIAPRYRSIRQIHRAVATVVAVRDQMTAMH